MKRSRVSEFHSTASELLDPVSTQPQVPAVNSARIFEARIFETMEQVWARMPAVGDSTDLVSEDRNRP